MNLSSLFFCCLMSTRVFAAVAPATSDDYWKVYASQEKLRALRIWWGHSGKFGKVRILRSI